MKSLLNWSIITVLFFLFNCAVICFSSNIEWYERCGKYFSCGNVTNVGHPFWGGIRPEGCGYPELELKCEDNATAEMEIMGLKYQVLDINQSAQIVRLARDDLVQGICLDQFDSTVLDSKLFEYADGTQNITVLYGCPPPYGAMPASFTCKINGVNETDAYVLEGDVGPSFCNASVLVPVLGTLVDQIGNLGLSQIVKKGFKVEYKVDDGGLCSECEESQGRCGFDVSKNETFCICPDGNVGYPACSKSMIAIAAPAKSSHKTVIIGVLAGGVGLLALLVCASLFIRQRRRRQYLSQAQNKDIGLGPPSSGLSSNNGFLYSREFTTSPSTNLSQSTPSYPSSTSDLDGASFYYGVKIFSNAELEEATDNFSESRELGDGGFGTVYYGKLHDGQLVAVKRLYESNWKRMGQFMNEVEILARLRHKYLVTLYGCTSKRSKELLLVYEYIPNGTVADHLHGKHAKSDTLPWSTRLNIAVQTAEALAFLHKSDVIHRDVKTTNILLDNNFQVKVADFGLSRLFPSDVTHVSTAPQGTPGYVDPEYYKSYRLTEKSDVYSFGVVLAELISSKPAVDVTRHRHDINLATMAADRIRKNALHELVDPALGYDKDYVVQQMVKLVAELAFQCLQEDMDMRPCMEEALKSLRGIQKEMTNSLKQVVVDIQETNDDVGLLKNAPPLSPETEVNYKRVR